MLNTKNEPTYEEVRRIPAFFLLKLSNKELKRIEGLIANEIERAEISLKFPMGVGMK